MLSSEIYGMNVNEFSMKLQILISNNPMINEIINDAAKEGIMVESVKTEVEEVLFGADPLSDPVIKIRHEIRFDVVPGIGVVTFLPVESLEDMEEKLINHIAKELCDYLDKIMN